MSMSDIEFSAIIVAAGAGRRMGSEIPKQFMPMKKKPLLYYSLKAFETADEIILVVPEGYVDRCRKEIVELYGIKKVSAIVPGGAERYDSVLRGIEAARGRYVMIHDGARPLVSQGLIEESMRAVRKYRACVPGISISDTIKSVEPEKKRGISGTDEKRPVGEIERTVRRSRLYAVQTPQCFETTLIKAAYEKYFADEMREGITDDASVMEMYSDVMVKLIEGEKENLKVTTPGDIETAEWIYDARKERQI